MLQSGGVLLSHPAHVPLTILVQVAGGPAAKGLSQRPFPKKNRVDDDRSAAEKVNIRSKHCITEQVPKIASPER